jgi:hypothetical protein
MNQIVRRKESAERRAVRVRNYQRARARAFVRLRKAYPDQYREFLEQEKAKDEANGKAWLDIAGTTANDSSVSLSTHRQDLPPRPTQTNRDEQDEGNVGGEE